MQSESFLFDPHPNSPYVITAKRYWHPQFYSTDADALTLICTHGVGVTKEHWEPTLEELYGILRQRSGPRSLKIREVWSLDAPNHGDAAVMNESLLSKDTNAIFRWEEYARVVHLFLSGQGTGVEIDFRTRRLVGVGHSMGGVAIVLAKTFTPTIDFVSMILVEPIMAPGQESGDEGHQLAVQLAKIHSAYALRGKETWPNAEEVLKHLRAKPQTKSWDPRIQRILVDHNTRNHANGDGLTLKCPRAQEAASYRDVESRVTASSYLQHLCSTTPVHFIYGEYDELIPRKYQDVLLRSTARGRHASVARVSGAGHAVPQINPHGLAVAILAPLDAIASNRNAAGGIKTRM